MDVYIYIDVQDDGGLLAGGASEREGREELLPDGAG
jgi:hypothetical protein